MEGRGILEILGKITNPYPSNINAHLFSQIPSKKTQELPLISFFHLYFVMNKQRK